MIFLLASARPERGDGTPVYYTVPWCPSLAEHPTAQLPGSGIILFATVLEQCRAQGIALSSLKALQPAHFLCAGAMSGQFVKALVMQKVIAMMLELEIAP